MAEKTDAAIRKEDKALMEERHKDIQSPPPERSLSKTAATRLYRSLPLEDREIMDFEAERQAVVDKVRHKARREGMVREAYRSEKRAEALRAQGDEAGAEAQDQIAAQYHDAIGRLDGD